MLTTQRFSLTHIVKQCVSWYRMSSTDHPALCECCTHISSASPSPRPSPRPISGVFTGGGLESKTASGSAMAHDLSKVSNTMM